MGWPILSFLIFFPLFSSLLIFILRGSEDQIKKNSIFITLGATAINFFVSLNLWYDFDPKASGYQFVEYKKWIVNFVSYKLGVDGISLFLILLTTFITPLCVLSVINSVKFRVKEFFIALLLMETFMIGVFCSLDIFLFFLFFEGGLIPMFLIIGIWGGERRVYSALKFFLYTFLGSIFLLIAIITIYLQLNSTDVEELSKINIPVNLQYYLWWGFFISLAVKLPMWPFHTWLPDAHVEAPTAGSVILAAILLKIAGYAFIRFSIGLFPNASLFFSNIVFVLSLVAIIYTSLVALMQTDMKKLIAYSSVAHMGYVTIGIFSFSKQGMDGAIFQMISHGFISSALFLCVGILYDRVHSRLIDTYKGIVNIMPIFSFVFLTSSLANVGLPGTSGFIGELLTLIGVFKMNYIVALIAGLGVILSAAYMLWLCKRLIFGNFSIQGLGKNEKLLDLNLIEKIMLFSLIILIILVGVYPNIILDTISSSVDQTLSSINRQIIIKKSLVY